MPVSSGRRAARGARAANSELGGWCWCERLWGAAKGGDGAITERHSGGRPPSCHLRPRRKAASRTRGRRRRPRWSISSQPLGLACWPLNVNLHTVPYSYQRADERRTGPSAALRPGAPFDHQGQSRGAQRFADDSSEANAQGCSTSTDPSCSPPVVGRGVQLEGPLLLIAVAAVLGIAVWLRLLSEWSGASFKA